MRIEGITIPDNTRLDIGLTVLFGVGRTRAAAVLAAAGVEPETRPKNLTSEQEAAIRAELENFVLEGELKRDISANIKRLKDIRSYRGVRHMRQLPVRGQRTKTNSRTTRGNVRKTMGSGRRTVEKK